GHAGGNQHQSAVFVHRDRAEKAKRIGGGCRISARLYGLPEHGQTDISGRLGGALRKPASQGFPTRPRRGPIRPSGLEPDPKWTPSKSIKSSVPCSPPALCC